MAAAQARRRHQSPKVCCATAPGSSPACNHRTADDSASKRRTQEPYSRSVHGAPLGVGCLLLCQAPRQLTCRSNLGRHGHIHGHRLSTRRPHIGGTAQARHIATAPSSPVSQLSIRCARPHTDNNTVSALLPQAGRLAATPAGPPPMLHSHPAAERWAQRTNGTASKHTTAPSCQPCRSLPLRNAARACPALPNKSSHFKRRLQPFACRATQKAGVAPLPESVSRCRHGAAAHRRGGCSGAAERGLGPEQHSAQHSQSQHRKVSPGLPGSLHTVGHASRCTHKPSSPVALCHCAELLTPAGRQRA